MVRSAATPRVSNQEAMADCHRFNFQTAAFFAGHSFAISRPDAPEFC
jgi:hypothetical protein